MKHPAEDLDPDFVSPPPQIPAIDEDGRQQQKRDALLLWQRHERAHPLAAVLAAIRRGPPANGLLPFFGARLQIFLALHNKWITPAGTPEEFREYETVRLLKILIACADRLDGIAHAEAALPAARQALRNIRAGIGHPRDWRALQTCAANCRPVERLRAFVKALPDGELKQVLLAVLDGTPTVSTAQTISKLRGKLKTTKQLQDVAPELLTLLSRVKREKAPTHNLKNANAKRYREIQKRARRNTDR